MNIISLVRCRDCGSAAYQIEDMGNGMKKYFCKKCNLKFIRYEKTDPAPRR